MYRDLLYVLHQSIVTPFLQLLQCKAYKARKWRQTRPGNDVKLSARVLVFCGSQSSGWRKQTWSRKCKMVDATIHSWTRTARLRNRNSRSLSVPLTGADCFTPLVVAASLTTSVQTNKTKKLKRGWGGGEAKHKIFSGPSTLHIKM